MRIHGGMMMDDIRTAALLEIDRAAELYRQNYITPGAGQSMVYAQKQKEAALILSGEAYGPADVPHLAMEAALDGVPIEVKAAEIDGRAKLWIMLSAQIEQVRLAAKLAARDAQTAAAIREATRLEWSSVGIAPEPDPDPEPEPEPEPETPVEPEPSEGGDA